MSTDMLYLPKLRLERLLTFYLRQVPERWVPYKFDLVGCSHQIFHVAVMVAACLHFVTLIKASEAARYDMCVW